MATNYFSPITCTLQATTLAGGISGLSGLHPSLVLTRSLCLQLGCPWVPILLGPNGWRIPVSEHKRLLPEVVLCFEAYVLVTLGCMEGHPCQRTIS